MPKANASFLRKCLVQGQIELEDVDMRLSEKAHDAPCRVFDDQGSDLVRGDTSSGRNSRDLSIRIGGTDVGIQAGC